jgi:hypothetical protein
LYNAPEGLESSAEVENHDASFRIVPLVILALRLGRWAVGVDGQLDTGLVALDTPTLFLFSSPDLVDDEGRKHGGGLAFARSGPVQALNFGP